MMRTNLWRGVLAAGALLLAAAPAAALDVGEKAPEIEVSEWVQGDPVKLADLSGKKVLLVVLWGTFESDCVDGMPELNKVLEKHKSAGLEIAAVSTEPADQVRTFLAYHKLDYRVAVDQYHKTADAYAGGERMKLPASWLVDKSGTVVWKGDPTRGLETVLGQVLEGKFDLAHAKDIAKRQQEMWDALWRNDWDKLAAACDKVLEIEPGDEQAFDFRIWAFRGKDDHAGFKAFMAKHVGRCKDDAEALRRAADQLAFGGGWDWRDVALAHDAARRAVELTKSGDADTLETYARVLFTVGLVDQAIAEQKKAVALEEKDQGHKQVLKWFEACAAARKKPAPPAKAPPTKK